MLNSISPITNKVYNALVKIYVSNDTVTDGLKKYTNGIVSIYENDVKIQEFNETASFDLYNLEHEENFVDFMKDVFDMNKDKAVIIETKLNELDNASIMRIISLLDYRDTLMFIDLIKNSCSSIFITNDVSILKLLTRLATRNLLFSTFHFLSKQITICCEPNLAFPIFTTDFTMMENCIEYAHNNHLYIQNMHIKY